MKLSKKIDEMIAWICNKISGFIGKIVTEVIGSPRPKATKKPNVPVNAGKNSGKVDDAGAKADVNKKNGDLPGKEGQCLRDPHEFNSILVDP